jgi:IS5 family transposase
MLFDDQIFIATHFVYGHRLHSKSNKTLWLDLTAPDYSTLCRRQKHINMQLVIKKVVVDYIYS